VQRSSGHDRLPDGALTERKPCSRSVSIFYGTLYFTLSTDIRVYRWYTSLLVTAAIAAGVAKFRLVDSVIANPVRLAVAWTYIAIALTCIIFGAGILLYAIVFPEPREDGTFSPAKGSSVAQRSAGAFAAVMAFTLIFGGLALPAPASGARSVASQAETGVPTGIPLQRISISASSSSPAD